MGRTETTMYSPPERAATTGGQVVLTPPHAAREFRDFVAQRLEQVIFYTLLVVIALTAIPGGMVEPWWIAVFECVVYILTALWIIAGLLGRAWFTSEHRLLVPLLALDVFAYLQTLPLGRVAKQAAGITWQPTLSADPFETWIFTLRLLALILAAGLLLRYTTTPRRLRAVIYTVAGVGVASALFGIARQATQRNGHGFIFPALMPDVGYAQFINRNDFAFLMEMALGLLLGLIAGRGVRRERLPLYFALLLTVWIALVLSVSRGGILAMFCQLLFLGLILSIPHPSSSRTRASERPSALWWQAGRSLAVRLLLCACLIAVTLAGVLWVGGESLAGRLEAMQEGTHVEAINERKGVDRAELWRATWQLVEDHPITGVGFGAYWAVITQYHNASGELLPYQAHNDYLEIMASGGLVGSLLAAWFIVAFARHAGARLRAAHGFRRAACLGALTGLFGVAVHSFVDFGLHVTVIALTFAALGCIAVCEQPELQQKGPLASGRRREAASSQKTRPLS